MTTTAGGIPWTLTPALLLALALAACASNDHAAASCGVQHVYQPGARAGQASRLLIVPRPCPMPQTPAPGRDRPGASS